jgi:hypothetical protein
MAQNNPALFDALMAGGCGGSLERWITSASSSSYDTLVDAVEAFATAVDAAIPTIGGNGPSISEINVLQSIAQGIIAGRNLVSIDSDTFADIAASIAAVFAEVQPRLNNVPVISGGGGGGVNQIARVQYIDARTAVPAEDQDGTIGAPFASVQDAIDALKAQIPTEGEDAGTGAYFVMAFPGSYGAAVWDPVLGGSVFCIMNATGGEYETDVTQDTQLPVFTEVSTAEFCSLVLNGIIVNGETGISVGNNGNFTAQGCQLWFALACQLSTKIIDTHLIACVMTTGGGGIDGGRVQSGTIDISDGSTLKLTNLDGFSPTSVTGALPSGATLQIDNQTAWAIEQSGPTLNNITTVVMTPTIP